MQFKANRSPPIKLGPRLFQRLRRRLRTVGSVPSEHSNQNKAWHIWYLLSLHTRSIPVRIRGRPSHPASCKIIPGDFQKPYKKNCFLGILALTKSIGF